MVKKFLNIVQSYILDNIIEIGKATFNMQFYKIN